MNEVNVRQVDMAAYRYELPEERIAQKPCVPRDGCRLLHVSQEGALRDSYFTNLCDILQAGDRLVLNNSGVLPARLYFRKPTGGVVEVLLMRPVCPQLVEEVLQCKERCVWECVVGGARKWKQGVLWLDVEGGLRVEAHCIERPQGEGLTYIIEFMWKGGSRFAHWLTRGGKMPIPPYMHRASEQGDREWYQTVYAQHAGSVAAPTAGLHFTTSLLAQLKAKGVSLDYVTLHVSAGTFFPVRSATLGEHRMHSEWVGVRKELLHNLIKHPEGVVAVGTTTLRTLESVYWLGSLWAWGESRGTERVFKVPQWIGFAHEVPPLLREEALGCIVSYMEREGLEVLYFQTALLIAPGYAVRMADGLVTNFHQPESTLLLLVDAFMGGQMHWRRAYEHALREGYSFLSYGDAMFIERGVLS